MERIVIYSREKGKQNRDIFQTSKGIMSRKELAAEIGISVAMLHGRLRDYDLHDPKITEPGDLRSTRGHGTAEWRSLSSRDRSHKLFSMT